MEQYIPDSTAPRTPPSHVASERAVLGGMLRSRESALQGIEKLTPEDFYDPANREIFSAMQHMAATSRPIEVGTLDEVLSRRGKLEAVGGVQYLAELMREGVPSPVSMPAYIQIVEDKATLRRLIAATERIQEDCYSGARDNADILESAEKAVYDITMRKAGEELQEIQPVLVNTFMKIEDLYKNHGRIEGVPTGYAALDELLTGLHGGEMILVAGRPAMGKTAIGMNFIENAAIRAGKKAAVFSLEMPAEQLAMRMLCTEARVDMQHVRRGDLQQDEWERLADALVTIGSAAIFIDCTPGITVPEMRSKARRLQMDHGLDVVLVDYLSLMSATGQTGSRQEEVSQISRTLKGLAMELNVPVIALQQLSRAPAGRSNHRPLLSDIRESGAIEQDADVVMFIHREEYYDPETPDKNMAELIIAKQRNGALGTVKLGWKGEYTWFMDLSPNAKEAVSR